MGDNFSQVCRRPLSRPSTHILLRYPQSLTPWCLPAHEKPTAATLIHESGCHLCRAPPHQAWDSQRGVSLYKSIREHDRWDRGPGESLQLGERLEEASWRARSQAEPGR